MARIRTIKPEFPQSESMGRVSRDARLLFVNMWTLSDDEGRLRGSSRLLASLLYPYDDDAAGLMDGWLAELEREGCAVRYEVDGTTYIQLTNWLEHQKIDRPSKSRLPPHSRALAKSREASATDLGPRTVDQEGTKDAAPNGAHAGSDLGPPVVPDAEYYRRVKQVVGPSGGGLGKKLLDAKGGNLALARAAIETASTKQDPREYLGSIIRGRDSPTEDARARGDAW